MKFVRIWFLKEGAVYVEEAVQAATAEAAADAATAHLPLELDKPRQLQIITDEGWCVDTYTDRIDHVLTMSAGAYNEFKGEIGLD